MNRERAALYVDAARSATPQQLVGRARRLVPPELLVPRRRPAVRPNLAVATGLGAPAASQWGPVPEPEACGRFTAAGAERTFADDDGFWTDGRDGLLFLFALHGFAELAAYVARGERSAAGDEFWSRVTESWLRREGRPRLPAWHPYPTSVRVAAWSSALGGEVFGDALAPLVLDSLARQVGYLSRAVERDIGGNHVMKNLSALVIAGSALGLPQVVERSLHRLERACREQFLADGGHVEKSTSYHREVVHDLGEAAEAHSRAGNPSPDWLGSTISGGDAWMAALTAPDGSIPMLNDSWEGPPLPPPTAPEEVTHLQDSGLVILRGDGIQAILDVGSLCPPQLPPHAHADALSFVLWADGRPLVVDPGAMTYTGEPRSWFRSTAAHNTVSVDGRDQCTFWGDFRAGMLPRVEHSVERLDGGFTMVRARHDGFRRGGPAWTERTFIWGPAMGLVIVDRLRGSRRHHVSSVLQFAPGHDHDKRLRVAALGGQPVPAPGRYAPYLGTERPAERLEKSLTVDRSEPFGWTILRDGWSAGFDDAGRIGIRAPDGAVTSFIPGLD